MGSGAPPPKIFGVFRAIYMSMAVSIKGFLLFLELNNNVK